MNTIIDKNLQAIEQALNWVANVPEAEQLQYKQDLINIRCELNKITFAVVEQCCTDAFGES